MSCERGPHLCVHVIIKQYLFLQGIQLISKALDSHTWLLQLLPCCTHCLVIYLWGHFGIFQLDREKCNVKLSLCIFKQDTAESAASQIKDRHLPRQKTELEHTVRFAVFAVKDVWESSCWKKKYNCLLPWPGKYAPVLPYKEKLAHHVASVGPGGITHT